MIEVRATRALNTVQDLGRHGQRHLGVGIAGAMDALALELANVLAGNTPDAAGIEVQTFPFELLLLEDTRLALAGADCAATLDGQPVLPWWQLRGRAGQVLRLEYPAHGARAYLAFAGGIAVPAVLGSRSTDLRSAFGGLSGRSLERGDRLPLGAEPRTQAGSFGVMPPDGLPHEAGRATEIRVVRAGEYERFPAQARDAFWDSEWQVTHQSNRAGYRLAGPPLLLDTPLELRSYGVVPGLVQVPPGGQPIIQLSDANSAGGYPKIATVIEADLWRLGQARAGSRIRFVDCGLAQARKAMQELRAWVAQARDALATGELVREGAMAP